MSQNAGQNIAGNPFNESALQAFLASEIEGVAGFSETLCITHWNKAAQCLAGIHAQTAVGMSVLQLFPELRHSAQYPAFMAVLTKGTPVMLKDLALFSGSGEKRYCSASCYPLFSGSGKITGGFALMREAVTPQHLSHRLNFAHQSLTRLSQYAQHLTCTVSACGRLLQVNPLFEDLLGYQASELIGQEALSFFHPDDFLAFENGAINLLDNLPAKPAFHRFRHKQGHYLWFESIGITLRHPQTRQVQELQVMAKPLPSQTIADRLTEEKSAAPANIHHVDLVLTVTSTGVWSWNAATERCTWDARVQQMCGLEPGVHESSFSDFIALINAEDRKQVKEVLRNTIATREKFDLYFRLPLPDKKQRYIHAVGGLLLLPNGAPDQILGLFTDVTDHREAEQKAREHKALLSGVFDSSLCGIALLDPIRDKTGQITDFRFRMINRLGAQMLGRTVPAIEGKCFLKEFPGTRREGIFSAYATVLETGEPCFLEKRYTHEGLNAWYALQAAPTGNSLTINFTDITLLKESQQQLLEKQYFQEKVNQTSPLLVAVLNLHTRQCTYANKPLHRFLNFSAEKQGAIGYTEFLDILHPDDRDRLQPCQQQVASAPDYDVLRFQFRMRDRQESWRWYQVFAKVFRRDAGGHVEEVLCMVQDIDEAEQTKHLLKSMFENSLNGIMAFEASRGAGGEIEDFRWVLLNKTAEQLLGRKSRFLLGRSMLSEVPAGFGNAVFQRFAQVIETSQAAQFEYCNSGSSRPAWYQVSAVKMEEGVAATFTEITKYKETETALQNTKSLTEKIIQNAPYFIEVYSLKTGEVRFSNQEVLHWPGIANAGLAHLAGEQFGQVAHPGDHQRLAGHFSRLQVAGSHETVETEVRVKALGGSWHKLQLCSLVFGRAADGTVEEVLTFVTSQYLTGHNPEQHIHDQEPTSFGTWEADSDSGNFQASGSVWRMLEFDPDKVDNSLGTFVRLIHPDDRKKVLDQLQISEDQAGQFLLECRIMSKAGNQMHIIIQGRKKHGFSSHWVGIILDVSQLREDSRLSDIRQEEERVVQAIPLPAWLADSTGKIEFANAEWEQFAGWLAHESKEFAWFDLLLPEDKTACVNKWLTAVETGKPFVHEAQVRNAEGNYRWLCFALVPLPEHDRQTVRWLGTATDTHDLKLALEGQARLEAALQLHQTELNSKTESLSKIYRQTDTQMYMAARNLALLHAIQGVLTNWQEQGKSQPEKVQQALACLHQAIQQLRNWQQEITETRLAENTTLEPAGTIGLGLLIEELKADLQNLINETAATIEYDLEVPQVNFARHNMRTILFNLLNMALRKKYINRPPRLTISTELTPENEVLLTVRDNQTELRNPGLPEELLYRNSEFACTEAHETNVQLVKKFVESGGGRFEAESQVVEGTTIRIYLRGQ